MCVGRVGRQQPSVAKRCSIRTISVADKPTRLERAEEVRILVRQGLNFTQVARKLGLSNTYVNGLYKDPDGSLDSARKKKYGGICVDCGGRTSYAGGGKHGVSQRCQSCAN